MISKIRPRSCHRYMALPLLGPIMKEFTVWSRERGYSIGTIRNQLKDSRWIDRFLRRRGARALHDLTHSSFQIAWWYYRHRQPAVAGTVRQIELFLDETHGLEPLPPRPLSATESELNRFADYLQRVRGLAASTIRSHVRYLKDFLEHIGYGPDPEAMTKLTSKGIESFLCDCARRLNRYSLQHVVAYLRSFLMFQYDKGVLPRPLHREIDTPRTYRLEQLPRSLPWETVTAFLGSIDRTNAHGIRDYTMFFLIAAYGLRACEIVYLTLDDIDWRARILRVPQRKTEKQLLLPLTDQVGQVLLEYLRKSRPKLPYRELFLRVRAPRGLLKPTAVTEAFQLRVRRSGLDITYQGPHCLRHSYAVHLLRQGVSLKAIGDLLGHQNAESTCAYLRLSTEDLRTVALPVPQGPTGHIPSEIISSKTWRRGTASGKDTSSRASPPTSLRSFLRGQIRSYLRLQRSLGRRYNNEARTLHSLDAFLVKEYPSSENLTAEIFNQWCLTFSRVLPGVRRGRMLHVRKFCLYRCRSHPQSFVPDLLTFPANHQPTPAHILSGADVAQLVSAAEHLRRCEQYPLRARTLSIAIVLLYTTGLRRGELLRLNLGDYNPVEKTLFVKDTKFHKSRVLPLSPSVTRELERFLALRSSSGAPRDLSSPLVWNGRLGSEARAYTGTRLLIIWSALCAAVGILTRMHTPPRIHDLRHSFAVNVLKRWYERGEDVQAKLPLLSIYMGHVSIASTCHYLPFVEGISSEAGARFEQSFGGAVTTACQKS